MNSGQFVGGPLDGEEFDLPIKHGYVAVFTGEQPAFVAHIYEMQRMETMFGEQPVLVSVELATAERTKRLREVARDYEQWRRTT